MHPSKITSFVYGVRGAKQMLHRDKLFHSANKEGGRLPHEHCRLDIVKYFTFILRHISLIENVATI